MRRGGWRVEARPLVGAAKRQSPACSLLHSPGLSMAIRVIVAGEERAATLTQFLLAGLVLQSGEEADGPLVSQEV